LLGDQVEKEKQMTMSLAFGNEESKKGAGRVRKKFVVGNYTINGYWWIWFGITFNYPWSMG